MKFYRIPQKSTKYEFEEIEIPRGYGSVVIYVTGFHINTLTDIKKGINVSYHSRELVKNVIKCIGPFYQYIPAKNMIKLLEKGGIQGELRTKLLTKESITPEQIENFNTVLQYRRTK